MTFLETFRRFMVPVIERPLPYVKTLFLGSSEGVYTIFSLEIFRRFLFQLQSGQGTDFEGLLVIYFIGSLIYLIFFQFVTPGWGWPELAYREQGYITEKYLALFVRSSNNEIEQIGTGKFLTVLDRGCRTWMDLLYDGIEKGSSMIIILLYGFYWIFSINIQIGFVALGLILLSVFVATKSNLRSSVERKRRVEFEHAMSRSVTRVLMSKNEMLQNKDTFSQTLAEIGVMLSHARKLQIVVQKWVRVISSFPLFLVVLLRILLYIYLSKLIFGNGMHLSEVAVFLTVITLFEKNLNSVLQLTRELLRDFVHIEKLWSTFDSLTPIKDYDEGNSFTPKNKSIEISSISYGYNQSKVFENFSLTIERGKKTALVGASGGGKTTLMKLIAGYLHPESGYISVLGNRLDETALKSYYPHIGYLTQDPSVFDGTIRENLLSAVNSSYQLSGDSYQSGNNKKNKTRDHSDTGSLLSDTSSELEQKLTEALHLAHCDFVFELDKGLDTEIGERGVRLSGGQKQRLAIAKIFLKNPEIILLDEPTSALDSFSEERITEALDTLFQRRTVIIIAHRLQTVKKADDIIVLEGGEVQERGTHESLVAKGGIYHKMLELQSGF